MTKKKGLIIVIIVLVIILLTLGGVFFYYNFTCKGKYEACMKRTGGNANLCPTHCNFYKYINVDHIEDYCERFIENVCSHRLKECSHNCNDYVPFSS